MVCIKGWSPVVTPLGSFLFIMDIQKNFQEAAEACTNHDFKTAKLILKEIVKCSKHSEAYRLLGQIAYEEHDDDLAIDYLIEALKIDPKNMWALIMMGNVYSKRKDDIKTARKYYDKVLESYPDNFIALNNVASVLMEEEHFEQAIDIFKKVISLDKTYPNSYYGMALAYVNLEKFQDAFDIAVEGAKNSTDRPENISVLNEIYKIIVTTAQEVVKRTNYMNVVLGIKDELEDEGHEKIKIVSDDSLNVYAKLEYGKFHHRKENVIRYNSKLPNVEHLMVHELGHLRMYISAEKENAVKVIHTTEANDAAFNKRFGSLIRKKLLNKISNEEIASIVKKIQNGICLQLMNCPLDLFVEHYIYDKYPVMRPIQFLMLLRQEQDNLRDTKSGEAASTFPQQIVKANKVMNVCTSLHLKEMYGIDLIREYHATKSELDQAVDLLDEFRAYYNDSDLLPGEEYDLLDYFLESLDMKDLITISNFEDFSSIANEASNRSMSVDAGDYDLYTDEEKERQKRFEENSKKADPARDMMMTFYILAALEEYSTMSLAKVKKIAMEIAMLGMGGIDPSKQSGYRIPSIDRDFSGYLILAYYYTSWKLAIPEAAEQLGLPYIKQYEDAQLLYKKKYGSKLSFD